jgi:hypothetical protein
MQEEEIKADNLQPKVSTYTPPGFFSTKTIIIIIVAFVLLSVIFFSLFILLGEKDDVPEPAGNNIPPGTDQQSDQSTIPNDNDQTPPQGEDQTPQEDDDQTPPTGIPEPEDACEDISSDDFDSDGFSIKDTCYYDLALETLNEQYCDFIEETDIRDDCYFNIAYETGQPEICDLISDPDVASECQQDIEQPIE